MPTHSSAHTDPAIFREPARHRHQRRPVSAGDPPRCCTRTEPTSGWWARGRPRLAWNGAPLPLDRPLIQRLREPEAGLGSGWGTWFYSRHPELLQAPSAGHPGVGGPGAALGPGACWLPERVNGRFPVLLGHALKWASAEAGDGVRLGFEGPAGIGRELTADHVIAATGYRADLRRLAFLSDQLRPGLRTIARLGSAVDRELPVVPFPACTSSAGRGPDLRARHALRVRLGPCGAHGGPQLAGSAGLPVTRLPRDPVR